jgi:hypothetical protein
VGWHVAHSATPLSAQQTADLEFALGGEFNARPLQRLNGRVPLELAFGLGGASTDDGTLSGSYGGHHNDQAGWDPGG